MWSRNMRLVSLVTLALAASTSVADEPHKTQASEPANHPIADRYRVAADRIMTATMAGNDAFAKMQQLCDDIGHRLSGSPQLERAVVWAAEAMRSDGQENVRLEPVKVPHWVRGRESAMMIKPRLQPLAMLGLGGSVGTPPNGVTAPVIVVRDEDEFEAAGERIRGKIVLFNNVMPPYDSQRGSGYGRTVRFRGKGARMVAEKGGVAALVRSVTAHSLRSPHTGAMHYGDATVKVPAAAISVEDADMIARLQARGIEPVVTLKMEARTLDPANSANVIGELRGRSLPDEVVVIGGHIDSWDVGQGAHDDGGGCVAAMEAINVLRRLGMTPKRTIRVVLWTNEENGLAGGKRYAKDHADELQDHVAAIESDSGTFRPTGYSVQCHDSDRQDIAAEQMRDILSLFTSIGAADLAIGHSGADLGPMKSAGVVLMGHRVDTTHYFDYHHSHADTLDKIDPVDLSRNVAVMATVAYILADMPDRLGDRLNH